MRITMNRYILLFFAFDLLFIICVICAFVFDCKVLFWLLSLLWAVCAVFLILRRKSIDKKVNGGRTDVKVLTGVIAITCSLVVIFYGVYELFTAFQWKYVLLLFSGLCVLFSSTIGLINKNKR